MKEAVERDSGLPGVVGTAAIAYSFEERPAGRNPAAGPRQGR